MIYSCSTFTVEINGFPTVVLQTKWHSEAEQICRAWAQQHCDQLTTTGRHGGLKLPPIVKLRLAHADEKAAYEGAGREVEYHNGVKIVYLVDIAARLWAHAG